LVVRLKGKNKEYIGSIKASIWNLIT